jgi:hypothetical protein
MFVALVVQRAHIVSPVYNLPQYLQYGDRNGLLAQAKASAFIRMAEWPSGFTGYSVTRKFLKMASWPMDSTVRPAPPLA